MQRPLHWCGTSSQSRFHDRWSRNKSKVCCTSEMLQGLPNLVVFYCDISDSCEGVNISSSYGSSAKYIAKSSETSTAWGCCHHFCRKTWPARHVSRCLENFPKCPAPTASTNPKAWGSFPKFGAILSSCISSKLARFFTSSVSQLGSSRIVSLKRSNRECNSWSKTIYGTSIQSTKGNWSKTSNHCSINTRSELSSSSLRNSVWSQTFGPCNRASLLWNSAPYR